MLIVYLAIKPYIMYIALNAFADALIPSMIKQQPYTFLR